MKFKNISPSYENITGYYRGQLIYIDKEVLNNTEFKGKLIKKRTRKWLVKE